MFEDSEPAIVLLDIDLPEGSGLDVLTDIKEKRPDTIAVMITGNIDVPNVITALRRAHTAGKLLTTLAEILQSN